MDRLLQLRTAMVVGVPVAVACVAVAWAAGRDHARDVSAEQTEDRREIARVVYLPGVAVNGNEDGDNEAEEQTAATIPAAPIEFANAADPASWDLAWRQINAAERGAQGALDEPGDPPLDSDQPDGAASAPPPPPTEVPTQAAQAAQAAPIACGPSVCPSQWVCCNESCGICTRPGELCSQLRCDAPMTSASVTCGPITCARGQLCCDPACGECVAPGQPCAPDGCLSPMQIPRSQSCGMTTCNVGTVCCNASCGICAAPGAPCSQDLC